MTDIVEFLTARLDEDEAVATRAARPESWVVLQPPRPDWYVQFWADPDRAAVIADPESSAYPVVASLACHDEDDEDLAEGRVEHIARHDPARVLAEVKAKRAILAAIQEADAEWAHVKRIAGDAPAPYSAARAFGLQRELAKVVLLNMAAPYADHPDYDPGWRVE